MEDDFSPEGFIAYFLQPDDFHGTTLTSGSDNINKGSREGSLDGNLEGEKNSNRKQKKNVLSRSANL